MKISYRFIAPLVALAFALGFLSLHAQDAPPPPQDGGMNQGAPPPPPDQGGPAPDQGAPGPDQGGGPDDQGASFQQFYDQLGSQGQWVQTDDYGYVFQPNVSDPNWAPYTDGHWVYSDAGWVWDSDEPWGWATYHYGRWANIDGAGWAWVPGYQWAPAWVSWRYGGGFCGWAPLPPGTFIGAEYGDPGVAIGIGFHFGGDVDVAFNIGPGCYNFVPVNYMGYRNYHGYYLDRSRNFVVINNTTNITNININRNNNAPFRRVAVGGPPINEINAHVATPIQHVRLTSAYQPGRASLNGDTLSVYAPHVNPSTAHTARPANVARTIAHPAFNRGDSITKPLAVNSTLRPTQPNDAQIAAAREAQSHVSPQAKIATERTVTRAAVTRPITSMQPVAQSHNATGATGNTFRPSTAGVQHPAGSPYTGEAATHAPPAEVHTPASPYTGENSNVQRPDAERATGSPYTGGEPVKRETTGENSNVQHSNAERATGSPSTGGEPVTRENNANSNAEQRMQQDRESNEDRTTQREPAPSSYQHDSAPVQHQTAPVVQHQSAPAPRPQAEPKSGGGNGGNNKNENGANGGPGGR